MATTITETYGSLVSNVWRAYAVGTYTDLGTQVVFEITGGINIPTSGYTSKRIFTSKIYVGSTLLSSNTYNNSGSTLTGVFKQGITTITYTVNKTNSTQSIQFKNILSGAGTSSTSTATLAAVMVPALSPYTIQYNSNSGSGTINNQTKTQGTAITLASSGFTRTNYTLVGWNTKSDGSGIGYGLGASYTNDADLTLYAQWQQNYVKPTISNVKAFRVNGTTATAETNSGTYIRVTFDYSCGHRPNSSTLVAPSYSIKINNANPSNGTPYSGTLSTSSTSFAPTTNYYTYATTSSHTITITISDATDTTGTTITTTVGMSTTPIDLLVSGNNTYMGIMTSAVSGRALTLPSGTYVGSNTIPNITITTTAPTASQGSNGDIWLVYTT